MVGEGKLKAGVPGAVRMPEVRRVKGGWWSCSGDGFRYELKDKDGAWYEGVRDKTCILAERPWPRAGGRREFMELVVAALSLPMDMIDRERP